jgi:hypothetical protein
MINSKNIKYKDIIAQTLLKKTSTEIKIHPLENHFIIEINYDVIVDAIVADLDDLGYTIIDKQQ